MTAAGLPEIVASRKAGRQSISQSVNQSTAVGFKRVSSMLNALVVLYCINESSVSGAGSIAVLAMKPTDCLGDDLLITWSIRIRNLL